MLDEGAQSVGATSGTTGDCTWTLDDNGTLTISGNGAMADDYEAWNVAPWGTDIKKVIIEYGVMNIGRCSFYNCENLTSITIPDSVTSIGRAAFEDCTSLTSITIPNSVTSIGSSAFYTCTSLKSITIPDSVISIGSSAFYETAWLNDQTDGLVYAGKVAYIYKGEMPENTSIVLKDGTKEIADSALSKCTGLKSITIPDSVTSIGWSAFSYCTSLTSVTIPNGVTSIAHRAFSGCISLERITIPDSVTSIDNEAFFGCESLTNITIPGSVTSIGAQAFYDCTGLTNITISDGVMYIERCAFYRCTSLTCITIPNSVSGIGEKAFSGCTSLSSITVSQNNNVYDSRNNCNAIIDKHTNSLILGCKNTIIPDSVASIGDNAFYGCANLTSITIPDSVTSIGSSAFEDCTSITNLTIGDGVTGIGYGAFRFCVSLANITVSPNNKHYDSRNNCNAIIDKETDTLFLGCKNTIIPDSIMTIGGSAFSYCTSLTSITIPESVTSIGSMAFYDCTSLASITIPDRVISIGSGAFQYCTTLTRAIIGNNVTSVGNYAFNYCTSLTNVTIGNSVTSIGEGAFINCSNLASITIPDSVTSIDRKAFYDCTSLTSIMIPNNVTSIGEKAFGYYYNSDNYSIEKTDGFTIYGYEGSEAERYANDNGFDFVASGTSKSIRDCSITLSPTVYTYDGTSKQPAITVKDSSTILTTGTHYTVSYPTAINAGTYSVTVTGKGDYSGSTTKTFSINPKPVTELTITLSQTNYTYDGTEKKPDVTVKDGSKTLTIGTDYTVSYLNNKNVGTATVTVTGKGNYTGSVNKTFNITEAPKTNVSTCTITLNPTTYTYDGTAKTPTVTVKDGSKTLTKDTDYTVSYSNNINIGTATVTVTGKGNYTGSVSKSFTITSPKKQFVWGQDNWNFLNSAPTYFPSSTYRKQINNTYLNKLKSNLTNSEYQAVFEGTWYSSAWLDSRWGGSCYGMSSLALLSKDGLLPYSSYQSGATKLYDLGYPKNNSSLLSLITYYQMLQVKDVIQQQYRTVPNKTNQENITNLINLLDKNPTVLVGFKKAGWGGHAILATGYEYGSWTFNGVSYQGCIKICDPNASTSYNTRYNIYFNTKSYNWTIPAYSNMTSTAGAKFNYIGAAVNEINKGGYLSGTSGNKVDDFVARIDAIAISDNRSVSKVENTNGVYINQSSQPDEIVEDYSFILGNESEGTIGYNLYDSSSSYKVSQDNAENLQLSIDYENCLLSGGSAAGTSVIFDKSGYVEVNGESAMYNISETFDNSYSTDWFTIQAQGYNANKVSLRMVDGGYVLTADKLENVTLKANNREHTARTVFSTNYTSVFIYEINENTIGLKVDTDNNGTYETKLSVNEDSSEKIGDTDLDGHITISDVTAIQRHLAELEKFTDEQLALADTNGDGEVDITDATYLQMYLAEYDGIVLGKQPKA